MACVTMLVLFLATPSVRSSRVSVSDPTSLPPPATPRLGPEQGGEDEAKESEQAGDHVEHQRLLRQLGGVREGGGRGQGRTHRGHETGRPVWVAHAGLLVVVIWCCLVGIP